MTWCHHYQITLKSQAHSRVPQCDGLPSIQSNRMVTAFTDVQIDLFATHLNHRVPFYVSPVPYQHAWDIDALNIIWSGLSAYVYPPTVLFHRVIQKSGNLTAKSL